MLHAHSLAPVLLAVEVRHQYEAVGAPGEELACPLLRRGIVPMAKERHARAGEAANGEQHPVKARIVRDHPVRPLPQRQTQQTCGDANAAAAARPYGHRRYSCRLQQVVHGAARDHQTAHVMSPPCHRSRQGGDVLLGSVAASAGFGEEQSHCAVIPMGNHRRHERHPLLRSRMRPAVRHRDAAARGDGRHGSDCGACCRCSWSARRAAQPHQRERPLSAAGDRSRGHVT